MKTVSGRHLDPDQLDCRSKYWTLGSPGLAHKLHRGQGLRCQIDALDRSLAVPLDRPLTSLWIHPGSAPGPTLNLRAATATFPERCAPVDPDSKV